MDFTELVEMIRGRQKASGLSVEVFAHEVGITVAALYNYYNGTRATIAVSSLRLFGRHFLKENDVEILSALAAYAVGIEGEFTPKE